MMIFSEIRPILDSSESPTLPPDVLSIERADIVLEPDFARYKLRVAKRLKQGGLPLHVPEGWPTVIEAPSSWKKGDFGADSCVHYLCGSDFKEIEYALNHFRGTDMRMIWLSLGILITRMTDSSFPIENITKQTFPLPNLGSRLYALSESLLNNVGFFILRGLDLLQYSALDRIIVFAGISSYLGDHFGAQGEYNGARQMLGKSAHISRVWILRSTCLLQIFSAYP
jgi:hypothetical protein